MADSFTTDSLTSPSRSMLMIVPSDSVALARFPKALYVGSAGDVTLRGMDDAADVTFRNVPAGSILLVRASHVRATGTTASDILGHC